MYDKRQAPKNKSQPVFIEVASANVSDSIDGAKNFEQGAKADSCACNFKRKH